MVHEYLILNERLYQLQLRVICNSQVFSKREQRPLPRLLGRLRETKICLSNRFPESLDSPRHGRCLYAGDMKVDSNQHYIPVSPFFPTVHIRGARSHSVVSCIMMIPLLRPLRNIAWVPDKSARVTRAKTQCSVTRSE